MNANTETTGADRTGCKAWCGTARTGSEGTWSLTADIDEVATRWCSQRCTDARLPPIAAPDAHVEFCSACEVGKVYRDIETECLKCGYKSCWTHVEGHVCKARHVERRKGQRWRCVSPSGKVDEGTIANATLTDIGTWKMEGAHEEFWSDSYRWWAKSEFTMTLLADATPEPASVRCAQHGAVASLCIQCKALDKSPPAQEAPKAAPVEFWQCQQCGVDDAGPSKFDGRTLILCLPCHNHALEWRRAQTGKPYAGPERLPKPQLAADWVEDCLPTVWR